MTKEEKQLLLKDLCARQPYGVKFKAENEDDPIELHYVRDEDVYGRVYSNLPYWIEIIKPYLRPMESMTAEEWLKLRELIFIASDTKGKICFGGFRNISAEDTIEAIDYLLSHHFDFRGLIEKGLALEAKEGMYKTE